MGTPCNAVSRPIGEASVRAAIKLRESVNTGVAQIKVDVGGRPECLNRVSVKWPCLLVSMDVMSD